MEPANGLARLESLLTPDLWSRVDSVNRAAVVGWGTMFNVVHLVKGVRILHAAGSCYVTVPLLRSIMEYTLGTMWLADAGDDAVDVFNRRLQYSHNRMKTALGDMDLDASFPVEAVKKFRDVLDADLSTHPDERLAAFTNLMNEYGFEKMVPVYSVLSGISHLSLEGAQMFFEDKGDTIRISQKPPGELMPCEQVCLGMQFDAMLAYNKLLEGKPWTAALTEIATDHQLPLKLTTRRSRRTSA
jgi:hypothetical protein